jgi:hypothetical protein
MVPKLPLSCKNEIRAKRLDREERRMMQFDADKVQKNVEQATTEDLLDRITVYLAGMEPEAVEIIERELARRGVMPEEVERHTTRRQTSGLVRDEAGWAVKCSRCNRPAAEVRWGWQRLFGLIPVFPRQLAFCSLHREGGAARPEEEPVKAAAPLPARADDHFFEASS